jgi:hypothetical protein
MLRLVMTLLCVGFALSYIQQCSRPHGVLGRRLLPSMNSRHSGLTDWGLSASRSNPAS